MSLQDNGRKIGYQPEIANVENGINELEAMQDDEAFQALAAEGQGAIAFIHFDPNTAKSNVVEALVHFEDLTQIRRGLYVSVYSLKDDRFYTGRIIEGPFYTPDALKRDSTPVQFIILNQGKGKMLTLPEYHGWIQIEILGEEIDGTLVGLRSRPHPASPVKPYNTEMMEEMLKLHGNILLGLLDSYENVFVRINGNDKGVMPRNWLTVGTIGSGKSNTNQVFIEETLQAGYAQIVIDPEGEYILMDKKSSQDNIDDQLGAFKRKAEGVKNLSVYRPPNATSARKDATPFSVPFDSLPPELIAEITEMNTTQQMRFTFLYQQAIDSLGSEKQNSAEEDTSDHWDVGGGHPGVKLPLLISILSEELRYYRTAKKEAAKQKTETSKKGKHIDQRRPEFAWNPEGSSDDSEPVEEAWEPYFKKHNLKHLKPLIESPQDVQSYNALLNKLKELKMIGIFDREDARPLNMDDLSTPGKLTVIDMSDADSQQIVNIVIADLLARMYHYKMHLPEDQQNKRKVFITIEEAHGFISREKQDKMEQTLDQLRRIARRGRKRWLALHFVTQSPEHLPSELFELANNKIIHQTTGAQNLRVLKGATGSINEAIWDDVPTLGRGRAVIVSSQFPHPIIVRIRPAASHRHYTE
ncbi:MAG: DUF87 domain-containing protein [Anaerolineae bacterium]|nr:DUF87 domain-containing protein [Anaerolineae bacterium]